MREQMKAMLDADEARIRADERARCAAIASGMDITSEHENWDAKEAAHCIRSNIADAILAGGHDPIAEARAAAFEEAARIAEANATNLQVAQYITATTIAAAIRAAKGE